MFRTHMATDYMPNYIRLYESGELERRAAAALASLDRKGAGQHILPNESAL